jgi:hypothetical protein
MTSTLISIRLARVAVVGLAVVAVAGCSSDGKKSDADSTKDIKRASAVKPEKTAPTTAPAVPSTSAAPTTAACTTAAAQPAMSPDTVHSIVCEGEFAAGDASNTHVDYAYLLQNVNGSWQKASVALQQEVCTTNSQGLPASFVANACND